MLQENTYIRLFYIRSCKYSLSKVINEFIQSIRKIKREASLQYKAKGLLKRL